MRFGWSTSVFHNATKHENDVSNTNDCLKSVIIYSFMKEIKIYICASNIVFLFVKTENNFIDLGKVLRILEQVIKR